jgi:hypothetical protein
MSALKFGTRRLVLGFYRSEEHAEEALGEVEKNGFRRATVVHCSEDGRLKFRYGMLSPVSHVTIAITMAVLVALVATRLGVYGPKLGIWAFCGFLLTWFGTGWLGFGLPRRVLRHYGRFVLPGESLVIVQEREERTADVIALLRNISHPTVFAIRPKIRVAESVETSDGPREPVTMASLPDCAADLAASHQLVSSTKSRSLLRVWNRTRSG